MLEIIPDFIKTKIKKLIISLLPLQDKVVFSNFNGKGWGCNPKYIAMVLHRLNPSLRLLWIVNHGEEASLPDYVEPLYPGRRFLFQMASSKVWVLNTKNVVKLKKKKGQFYIQTWHGSVGIKKIERDAEESLSQSYIQASKEDSKMIDMLICNNEFFAKRQKDVFWLDKPIVVCGMPRDAILVHTPKDLRNSVLDCFKIPHDKKIVLYAPTFRKGCGTDEVVWDYQKAIDALNRRFGGEFVMLLRLHPNIAEKASCLQYNDTVISATDYSDMQELLVAADVVISDYSSIIFEFGMLTKKPSFIYASDVDQYAASDRGLEFTFEELPFSLSKSEEQLVSEIANFNESSFLEKIEAFNQRLGLKEDGNGDEYMAHVINDFIKTGKRG